MSGSALGLNVNQLQGLSAAQLEQLTTITSLAKGSGFLEGKKGGEGFMGSFVDSATGQKHYIKMLTHGNERKDALGNNAQEANLLSGSKGQIGEMSNSMKADLLELARAVGVEDKVQKLFDSPKKNDGFKDLVSRKIALEAAKLIGDAHNDKSGVNGARFDWKAVARAEKSGDTTLGNVLLMKERNLLEGISAKIKDLDEKIGKIRSEGKVPLTEWMDVNKKFINNFKTIEKSKEKLESAVKERDNLIEDCNKTVLDCTEAIMSAEEKIAKGREEFEKSDEKNSIVAKKKQAKIERDNTAIIRENTWARSEATIKLKAALALQDEEIKKCTEAFQSALQSAGLKEEDLKGAEYQKFMTDYSEVKNMLHQVNSDIDRYDLERASLMRSFNNLKSGIEKVERGLSDVDTLAQTIEKRILPNIKNRVDASNGTPDVIDTPKFKDTLNTLVNTPAMQEVKRNAEAIKGALPQLNNLVEELKAGDDAKLVIKLRDKANELLKNKGQLIGANAFCTIVSELAKSNGTDDAISNWVLYRPTIRGMFPDNS